MQKGSEAPSAVVAQESIAPLNDAQAASREKASFLQGWSEALAEDASVATFAVNERTNWQQRVEALGKALPPDFAQQADALAAEAKTLHLQAGEIQLQFDARNQLLTDIIQSMKEIGYFVSDPYFVDPDDPTSSVVLKATCGSQVITTAVDLRSMVKSIWDGQEHEGCKEAFFDYVDAMKLRGVEVDPEREDLRERPVLKQKGANELPRSTDTGKRMGG